MAGYYRFSMSNNARAAYADGARPWSAWTRAEILDALDAEQRARLAPLTVAELRARLLVRAGWHHTSARYNRTPFYRVDFDAADNLTAEDVARIVERRKQDRALAKAEKATRPEQPAARRARVRYTVWEGTRKHPRPRAVEEVVTIPTGGGMVQTANGNKRQTSLIVLEWID